MNIEDVGAVFNVLNDAGIRLGFGRDACTNIPNPSDPDDSGWHLMLHDERLFDGRAAAFNRILMERAWNGSTRSS